MTKQPEITEAMIQQAEELQRLGLCQGAKEWVIENPDYMNLGKRIANKPKLTSSWEEIGPLPTASECWPEIREVAKKKGISFNLSAKLLELSKLMGWKSKDIIRYWNDIEDLDQAFRQALIELKKAEETT